jgi:site-specific DNA-cytosine methylase
MLLNQSSPLGAFSKILLEFSHWTNSEEYCYVWNRLDTRFALSAFQLTPLEQSTGGSEYSLWRTPDANGDRGGMDGEARLSNGHALTLNDQVKTAKLWPTPTCKDSEPLRPTTQVQRGMRGGSSLSDTAKLWPMPTSRDSKDGTSGNGRTNILGQAVNPSLASGSLNPRFVENLMGFPIDHTALRPSETPLCRSRRTRSSKRSRLLKGDER